jgi:hypothetical protein
VEDEIIEDEKMIEEEQKFSEEKKKNEVQKPEVKKQCTNLYNKYKRKTEGDENINGYKV